MPTEEFLKEQERHSLAEELMDMALMARGTQKLFSLIGKECNFDLDALQREMNGLTKAQRDALEMKQLFDVVNDLTKKKKEADELARKQREEMDEAAAEKLRLQGELEAQAAEAQRLAAERDAKHEKELEDLQADLEEQLQKLLAEKDEAKKRELEELMAGKQKELDALRESIDEEHKKELERIRAENEKNKAEYDKKCQAEMERLKAEIEAAQGADMEKMKKASEAEKEKMRKEAEKREAELKKRLANFEAERKKMLSDAEDREYDLLEQIEDLQRSLKEAQELAEKAAENEELHNEINDLKLQLEEANKKIKELEVSESAAAIAELHEQIGKLYWVNKELIAQIKERDNQSKRLQGDFQSLQYEDKLKNMHIDTLDAKSREKDHQRDILLMTKKELEEANARLDKITEEHEVEIGKLVEEIALLRGLLDAKEQDINTQVGIIQDWKPKVAQLSEKDKEIAKLKITYEKVQSSFFKLKDELKKEQRRRELLEEQKQMNDSSADKFRITMKSETDEAKKVAELNSRALKSKERELQQLNYALQTRESEIHGLRQRVDDLEYYLSKSIALNSFARDKDTSKHPGIPLNKNKNKKVAIEEMDSD